MGDVTMFFHIGDGQMVGVRPPTLDPLIGRGEPGARLCMVDAGRLPTQAGEMELILKEQLQFVPVLSIGDHRQGKFDVASSPGGGAQTLKAR